MYAKKLIQANKNSADWDSSAFTWTITAKNLKLLLQAMNHKANTKNNKDKKQGSFYRPNKKNQRQLMNPISWCTGLK